MVISDMAAGRFRPKLREMFHSSGKTVYQVAKDGGLYYISSNRYLREENRDRAATDALCGILRGLGYTWDEIRTMPLGEVYEIAPEDEALVQ